MGLPINEVVLGDCIEVMARWPENSVDLIVTDPPYGIQFMGLDFDKALPPRAAFEQMIRVLKPGALAFVMSSPRQDVLWRMLALLEGVGFELTQSYIDWIYKTGFPKAYDVSKGIDKKLGVKGDVIGEKKLWGHNAGTGAGSFSKNSYEGQVGIKRTEPIFAPASELAKEWDGWKSQTGLKPAHEPVLMVNKPRSEKTIVENVLRWGTGAINVDACRIPLKGEDISDYRNGGYLDPSKENWRFKRTQRDNIKGRFPANLIISNGALDTGEITGGGKFTKKVRPRMDSWRVMENRDDRLGQVEAIDSYGDEGSPFRFFDLDAWAEHHGFLDVAKPSKAERDFGLNTQPLQVPKSKFNLSDGSKDMRFDGVIPTPRRNIHPTCKPVRLMAYLIELGCPPKGIVVDPFVGSGTTCVAAKRLRRRWIGIEINPEYAEIARARIDIKGPLDQYMEAET